MTLARLGPAAIVLLVSLACSSDTPAPPAPDPEPDAPSAAPGPDHDRGKRPRRQRPDKPAEREACSVSAYVIDDDPKGLNVRDAPEGKVIGQLSRITMVGLRESRDGWVRYEGASDWDEPGEPPEAGWVYANLLGIDLKGPPEYEHTQPVLRNAPTADAKTREIPVDPLPKVELVGCSGSYWEVKVKLADGKVHQGFLGYDSGCGNPQTTCP